MPGFQVVWQEASHGFCSPCSSSTDVIFTDLCILGREIQSLGQLQDQGTEQERRWPRCAASREPFVSRTGSLRVWGQLGGELAPFCSSLSPKRGIWGAGRSRQAVKPAHLRAGGGLGAAQPLFLPQTMPGHGGGVAPSPPPLLHPLLRCSIPSSGSRGTCKPMGWRGGRAAPRFPAGKAGGTLLRPYKPTSPRLGTALGRTHPKENPPQVPKNHDRQRIRPSG